MNERTSEMQTSGFQKWKSGFRSRKMIKIAIGVVVGAALGFAYYRFIGCAGGACPITRNPYISTIYGALVGLLLTVG
jgi:hypothetical protein